MSRRVRHVVFFYFDTGASAEEKAAVGSGLGTLPAVIPEILRFDYHTGAGLSDDSADAVLISEFADDEAWRTYQTHPEHRRVVDETISPILDRLERCQAWIDVPS